MRFGILGPVVAWRGDETVRIPGVRARTVLAMLLLRPRTVVTLDQLVDALYPDVDPPKTARNQAQTGVARLRAMLGDRDGPGEAPLIVTHPHGYLLDVADERIDAFSFSAHVEQARQVFHEGRPDVAADLLAQALGLWRGEALEDVPSQVVRSQAVLWDGMRIAALERRITADLECGRHGEVVAELEGLAAENPHNERFHAQLMLALYRTGRSSDALDVYNRLHRNLDELGAEPGNEVRHLQTQILRHDSTLLPAPASRLRVPRQLPVRPAALVGRGPEVDALVKALTDERGERIVAVSAGGGHGKTALAVEVAHRVAEHFEDGQLFADLGGARRRPVDPERILGTFLAGLGMPPDEIPEGLAERASAYRTLTADRRLLVLLDDAAGTEQVRPLLPGGPGCRVLITSQSKLTVFPAVMRLDLPLLTPADARALLARHAGPERVDAEPDAVRELATLCGGVPLALDIAGARLAARPHWPISRLAARLADIQQRLSELSIEGCEIRSSLELGYDPLSPDAKRMLRRVSLLGSACFSAWEGAALIGGTVRRAAEALEDLVEAHLATVEGMDGSGHYTYTVHDLVRAFSWERLEQEESEVERAKALERAVGAALAVTDAAHAMLYGRRHASLRGEAPRWQPQDSTPALHVTRPAQGWLASRLPLLTALATRAAEYHLSEACWELAVAPLPLFETGDYFPEWATLLDGAMDCVRRDGNVRGEAALTLSLAFRAQLVGDGVAEERLLRDAANLFHRLGDTEGEGLVAWLRGDEGTFSRSLPDLSAAYSSASELLKAEEIASEVVRHDLARILRLQTAEDAGQVARERLERVLRAAQETGEAN
ncbi:AfsR/SARP family transcriptional regulator [Actinomadura rupiterrae]|uniref:AfsR/SARP family transcriptional regulator n=1 Tax=Actinomadura rupiterrae TaxID=559627 RepID=UPI0020A35BA9|nr:AfsR/SARP family transcriptional regulator [Actinomadura rupiterrae]MCP2338094.1 DNA-binding SARP family transcriptional activator [Actinomadura rupiterrae]